MEDILGRILSFKEAFITIVITMAVYYLVQWVMTKSAKGKTDWGVIRSSVLFAIVVIGGIAMILALPMDDSTRGNISSLIGIVISAVLALSSATFMGNGLAGVMLRTINNFRHGDFIHTEDHFGRVTERGLFHTEIQTENRDLITIPNLYLATNPVRTTRSSGTFISAVCSLGYDVSRIKIEKALISATEKAGLKDGFVRITDLGDFSVVYKTFGLLKDVKTIISAESKLNAFVLDALHEAGIEIVSPSFMNQRQVGENIFIPKKASKAEQKKVDNTTAPEDKIFDKADEAESLENNRKQLEEVDEKIKACQEELSKAENPEEIEKKIERYTKLKIRLEEKIDIQSKEITGKKK